MKLEVLQYKERDDKEPKAFDAKAGVSFRDGDLIGFRISNSNDFPIDIALYFLSSDGEVQCWYPRVGGFGSRVNPGETLGAPIIPRADVTTTGDAFDRMVLIAVRAEGAPADFPDFELGVSAALGRDSCIRSISWRVAAKETSQETIRKQGEISRQSNSTFELKLRTRFHEMCGRVRQAFSEAERVTQLLSTASPSHAHWSKDAQLTLQHFERVTKLEDNDQATLALAENAEVALYFGTGRNGDLLESKTMLIPYVLGIQQVGGAAFAVPRGLDPLSDGKRQLSNAMQLLGGGERPDPIEVAKKIFAIRQRLLGDSDPATARAAGLAGALSYGLGRYAEAEKYLQLARELSEQSYGKAHPEYASALDNLGRVFQILGRQGEAFSALREACEIRKATLGEFHPDYATGLGNLGGQYYAMGDYQLAEDSHQLVLKIRSAIGAEDSRNVAYSLNNLAGVYMARGNLAKAEEMFKRACETLKKSGSVGQPLYAIVLNNLATVNFARAQWDEAGNQFEESLQIIEEHFGKSHPYCAIRLHNLGEICLETAELDTAKSYLERALNIRQRAFGTNHPDCALTLNALGRVYEGLGRIRDAEGSLRESANVALRNVQKTALVQSERQQLNMVGQFRAILDDYLSLSARAPEFSEQAYQNVFRWKGIVLARQRATRAADSTAKPEAIAELQRISSRLAALAVGVGDNAKEVIAELDSLTKRKEDLERSLSGDRPADDDSGSTLTALREVLPPATVLVDFIDYRYSAGSVIEQGKIARGERRMAAFLVRKAGSIERVELGATKELDDAIGQWRTGFGRTKESRQAGVVLRDRLWTPLRGKVTEAEVILISGDGPLGTLPFGAIPVGESEYLLEQRSITTVAAPQTLRELLRRDNLVRPESDVLLLGGVDYDAQPSQLPKQAKRAFLPMLAQAGQRSAGGALFQPLSGTSGEVNTIEKTYRENFEPVRLTTLTGPGASKEAFLRGAAKHAYLHLATHGFFAPPEFRSTFDLVAMNDQQRTFQVANDQLVSAYHPGLLSGIALAGANREANRAEGIITAEEVGSLNLANVHLAVLSACETGLGKSAGGEGLLGLQRAFQVAGARTVIASLWKVDDVATRDLMERFYDNLWNKNMGKLESLREAQLWMLKERGPRGLAPVKEPGAGGQEPGSNGNRLPPYYWAAWVLSGDWR